MSNSDKDNKEREYTHPCPYCHQELSSNISPHKGIYQCMCGKYFEIQKIDIDMESHRYRLAVSKLPADKGIDMIPKGNDFRFPCTLCNHTIHWKTPTIVLNEVFSFEFKHCGQFFRVDEIDFEKQKMIVVMVDREKATNAMRKEGLL